MLEEYFVIQQKLLTMYIMKSCWLNNIFVAFKKLLQTGLDPVLQMENKKWK
jgi:hypothetical protein